MGNEDVDRRTAILNAAVESFGTLGYYGTSLQKIATMVGLTKAGVLHYVGSKEGLLTTVLNEMYDRETEDVTANMVHEAEPLIADMWRRVVAINAKRPKLVHMFSTLSAEALNPDHPAHDYFATREEHVVDVARNIRWRVPAGVDAEQMLRAGFAMMDGIQLRWLRKPGQNLNAMWARCEDVLFPLPQWEGCR
ncbi:TetR family transcriptional regulator [Bifidobacterium angulatum]|uniref:TetR/AcrR family transcriptional regulator n=1 Tax=Bifidobacterium angulatum TaxID=1683 RepID=UPI00406C7957